MIRSFLLEKGIFYFFLPTKYITRKTRHLLQKNEDFFIWGETKSILVKYAGHTQTRMLKK